MFKKHNNKSFFLILTFLFTMGLLTAEDNPSSGLVQLSIDDLTGTTTAQAFCGNTIEILLPEQRELLDGIEIQIAVPRVAASSREKVNWTLYEGSLCRNENGSNTISGEVLLSGTFANTLSAILKIPFAENTSIKKDPYSVFSDRIPDIENNRLYLNISLPSSASRGLKQAEFAVTLKPVMANRGILDLSVSTPDQDQLSQDFTCYVDGNPFMPEQKLILEAGQHQLSIQSETYRSENITFNIEKGSETQISVELKDIIPNIRYSAPAGTLLYVDGEETEVSTSYVPIPEGIHNLRFIIGDYEITRTITAYNGRNYTVSITLDALISEE